MLSELRVRLVGTWHSCRKSSQSTSEPITWWPLSQRAQVLHETMRICCHLLPRAWMSSEHRPVKFPHCLQSVNTF